MRAWVHFALAEYDVAAEFARRASRQPNATYRALATLTASLGKLGDKAQARLATALGRRADLKQVRNPLFLLAARDDEVVAPAQLLATARLVGTSEDAIETAIAPGTHLSLFLGGRTIARTWPKIAHWLQ